MSNASPRRYRLASALAVAALSTLLARPASAQAIGTAGSTGTTTTTTASLADGDIFIGVQQTEGANLAAFDLQRFFNKANCDCDTPVFLYFTLTNTGFAKRGLVPTGTVSFWVGAGCATDVLTQKTSCQFLQSDQIATFMQLGRETIKTSARVISANSSLAAAGVDGGTTFTNGTVPNPDCTSPSNGFNQTIWAVFDYGADGSFDYAASTAVFVDLQPPPAPTNISVAGGNEAVTIKWTPVDYSLNMDLQGYQIFCQRGGGLQVFPNNTFGSAVKACTSPDGGVMDLDPLFACSPLLNRTVDSYRVKILQNGIPYGAAVVAIDNSGNALAPVLAGENFADPQKTLSFYDVYRDGNITNGAPGQMPTPGQATGGLCAVGGGRTAFGAGSVAFAALAATLVRARRRRR
ncbi:MAG TPA: hypothetical protein VHL80_14485 [Polyangia bacterium]|nr:hypothetical protein [Polyangia bacterium]